MKRLLPLAAVCALVAATPAGAHPLTVHQAKHAIRTEYAYANNAPRRLVTVGHCHRRNTTIQCTVTQRLYTTCFVSEHWTADPGLTQRVVAEQAPAPHQRGYGKCPNVTITPISGQPSYLPGRPTAPSDPTG